LAYYPSQDNEKVVVKIFRRGLENECERYMTRKDQIETFANEFNDFLNSKNIQGQVSSSVFRSFVCVLR